MAIENRTTARHVIQSLAYDPKTGEFSWINKIGNSGRRKRVGHIKHHHCGRKYLKIGVHYQSYYAHRLAWLLMTGQWPKFEVDHINGNGLDNRWSNLRAATHEQNTWNRRSFGLERLPSGHWRTRIGNDWIGTFDTQREALDAYRKEILRRYGEFAHLSFQTTPPMTSSRRP